MCQLAHIPTPEMFEQIFMLAGQLQVRGLTGLAIIALGVVVMQAALKRTQ